MTSENKKQKRTAISDEIKHEICEFHTKNSHLSHIDIALHFNQLHNFDIKRTTISKILKDKGRWLSAITNPPIPTYKHHNSNYNCEDLKVFRKYLKLMNLKLIEDKKQTSINTFYSIAE
ncbi:17539_t:CDS:2 [Funneliformis caledonium]|uniref:17539_t:CDS:1 n=1 Tax=Funneliformis caledonium TaxID=1117310 RepID=A0A9N8YL04_9GLOM|nr:17539_t:CDS:2 [Funneliformis caledonium]